VDVHNVNRGGHGADTTFCRMAEAEGFRRAGWRMVQIIILRWALAQHGGQRRGAGRPIGSKTLRPSAALIEAARVDENLIPVKFEGDSLEFLRATMTGKIWPMREQIYAAKSVLPIEHPAGGLLSTGAASRRSVRRRFANTWRRARLTISARS
jgi:hypothetical protein